jgi:CDP-diacylglycerol--serine O-phosphatidyltransferase
MDVRSISKRLMGPGGGRPRPRAAYALPTLFTAGNLFLGFISVMRSIQGVLLVRAGATGANNHFEVAAAAIGWAAVLDGLDGWIARLTNTASDFGREMDSLADVITFGVAPAVLAYCWGVQGGISPTAPVYFRRLAYFIPFLFLLCGAARLARFNIQKNPVPKNPGRPDRKYFVGLPIPAAALMVAAVVFVVDGTPILDWPLVIGWLALLAVLAFLMVSTWRYRSFKDFQVLRPRSWVTFVVAGAMIGLLAVATAPALLALSVTYVGSGMAVRLGGVLRRRLKHSRPEPEQQVG